jgi:hypothetical protein
MKPLMPVAQLEAHYPIRRSTHGLFDPNQNWDYDLAWDDDMPDAYGEPITVYVKERIHDHIWELMQGGADVVKITYFRGYTKRGERIEHVYLAKNEFHTYTVKKAFRGFFQKLDAEMAKLS